MLYGNWLRTQSPVITSFSTVCHVLHFISLSEPQRSLTVSGHGSQVDDVSGDEEDGKDEGEQKYHSDLIRPQ